ncbi:MAG TPA: hypothetical protein VF276_06600, partial [Chloroflexia bacterium]
MDALGDKLVRRWIDFGRLLRRNGVQTTADQMHDLLSVLSDPTQDWTDRQTIYYTARALLCSRHEDWPRFDLIFRQFWGRTRQVIIPSDSATPRPETQLARERASQALGPDTPGGDMLPSVERTTAIDAPDLPGGETDNSTLPDQMLLYSGYERLRQIDFADFTDDELAQARAMLATWRWEPGTRRTRRLTPARRGHRLDVE